MSFEGFPAAALDFYDDLEVDNTKSFWEAHQHIYKESVLAPMKELTGALEMEFGTAKIFRPYKDVRFSKDKTPYKTHQGAFVAVAPQTGFYIEVSPRGVRTGGGCYWFEPPRLAAFREAIDHDRFGPDLEKLLKTAVRKGYEVGGDRLKTKPRGYDADHPRIELLKHKSLTLGRMIGFEPVIHTGELLDLVRKDWRAIRPVTDWIAEHAAV
ncbi:DUF2461 domain-containing protein [Nocardioides sp. Kera G14]|uniref:DUF2461 domain-containing protein n=1 Tax=Nocardioides sp. Kera G14 TaxID=2884264 RepID=UPI001D112A45|nr:DUF2461 domain-containing protein [Nocardioides sp. Kera G14]UDY23232.1 DUF2461 domain-containing protein [Nocardioides sp. Kera G14]